MPSVYAIWKCWNINKRIRACHTMLYKSSQGSSSCELNADLQLWHFAAMRQTCLHELHRRRLWHFAAMRQTCLCEHRRRQLWHFAAMRQTCLCEVVNIAADSSDILTQWVRHVCMNIAADSSDISPRWGRHVCRGHRRQLWHFAAMRKACLRRTLPTALTFRRDEAGMSAEDISDRSDISLQWGRHVCR